jgi:hypothetical protein
MGGPRIGRMYGYLFLTLLSEGSSWIKKGGGPIIRFWARTILQNQLRVAIFDKIIYIDYFTRLEKLANRKKIIESRKRRV